MAGNNWKCTAILFGGNGHGEPLCVSDLGLLGVKDTRHIYKIASSNTLPVKQRTTEIVHGVEHLSMKADTRFLVVHAHNIISPESRLKNEKTIEEVEDSLISVLFLQEFRRRFLSDMAFENRPHLPPPYHFGKRSLVKRPIIVTIN